MSNERSPREVCSMTIGMRGLMQAPSCWLLAAGGPQLLLDPGGFLFLFLVRRPELLSRRGGGRRDRLDVGEEPVEGGAQAKVLPDRFLLPVRPPVLDQP